MPPRDNNFDQSVMLAPRRKQVSRCVWFLIFACACSSPAAAQIPATSRREPIRILNANDDMLVVNRRSGSVSQFRPAQNQIVGEWPIATRLADCVPVQQADAISWFVAADDEANRLILWNYRSDASADAKTQQVHSIEVHSSPTHLVALASAQRLIASLSWAHELLECEVNCDAAGGVLQPIDRLSLPFIPGCMIATPDERQLVVADACGPYLAIVTREPLQLKSLLRIPGHNVGDMAWTPDGSSLQLTHVMLNDFIPTTRDHVFWGNVVSSMLRVMPCEDLLKARPDSLREPFKLHGSLFPLGRESQAAGDPGTMLVTSQDDLLIAIQGTHELAVRLKNERLFTRLAVGKGPSAIGSSADGNQWVIASRWDDRLTQIDRNSLSIVNTIALSIPTEPTLVERGEQLFYDSTLSLDGWFSCHSCHTNGHSCGLLNDNFGDSRVGAPKQIPTLLGTHGTTPWAWNGMQPDLADQIRKSLEQTLRSTERKDHPTIDEQTVAALTAYLETLTPAPSLALARGELNESSVASGQQLFVAHDCITCHAPPRYTSASIYDVGLRDDRGSHEFNPPSLRGVSQRARWLHDGRARSLLDVLQVHPHPDRSPLTDRERADLVSYLETL